eukprot:3656593-Lingulodinium_polyedra.AAC.1
MPPPPAKAATDLVGRAPAADRVEGAVGGPAPVAREQLPHVVADGDERMAVGARVAGLPLEGDERRPRLLEVDRGR